MYWWFIVIIYVISKLTSEKTNEFINAYALCPNTLLD